jgi:hypothetical protein
MSIHTDLAAGRWSTLTLAEQLAHVGSEVERALRAWEASHAERRLGRPQYNALHLPPSGAAGFAA